MGTMDAKTRRIVRLLTMEARAMEADSMDWSAFEREMESEAVTYYMADFEALEIGGEAR
jgi:hypothetical protein